MKIYTKTGDKGQTSLIGGTRVPKHHIQIEAYGTVDELNACIGVAIAAGLDPELVKELSVIQNDLFHLGSDLCMSEEVKVRIPVPKIEQRHIDKLEQLMDRLLAELPPLENFVLPSGALGAAQLHVARTVCRRAERLAVALGRKEPIGAFTIKYLNRLSDTLFVMSRYENKLKGCKEACWDSKA